MNIDMDLRQMKEAIDIANELVEKLKEARDLSESLASLTGDCLNFGFSETAEDERHEALYE